MDWLYIVLANAAFGAHLLFVLALGPSTALFCLGGYRKHPVFAQLHCAAVYGMAVGQTVLKQCPLVLLEHTLREAAGESRWYYGSFSVFVVKKVTGYELPVEVIFSLSTLVVALTSAALLSVCLQKLVARGQRATAPRVAAL